MSLITLYKAAAMHFLYTNFLYKNCNGECKLFFDMCSVIWSATALSVHLETYMTNYWVDKSSDISHLSVMILQLSRGEPLWSDLFTLLMITGSRTPTNWIITLVGMGSNKQDFLDILQLSFRTSS